MTPRLFFRSTVALRRRGRPSAGFTLSRAPSTSIDTALLAISSSALSIGLPSASYGEPWNSRLIDSTAASLLAFSCK